MTAKNAKEIRDTFRKEAESFAKWLSEREGVPILCTQELSGTWLHSRTYTSELRILLLADIQITVSRVCFINRCIGTMTAALRWLENFAKRNHIGKIVIQSVETDAMRCWCLNHGFQPNPSASIEMGGKIYGDYIRPVQ